MAIRAPGVGVLASSEVLSPLPQEVPGSSWPEAAAPIRRQAEAQLVYRSALLQVGRFEARPGEPLFRHSGPPGQHVFAFPHSAVRIRHDCGPAFVTDPSVVTYYNPPQIYFREELSPLGDLSDWLSLRPDVVSEIASAVDPRLEPGEPEPFRHPVGPCDARSFAVERALMRAVRSEQPPDALLLEETAVRLLERLLRGAAAAGGREPALPAASQRAHRELAEAARERLALRFAHQDSLLDLATSVGCSVAHLCRVFRAWAGTSLHAHRNQLRLRRALDRLAEPGLRLVDLAVELGYSSHSHLTAAFRRHFGVAPRQLRRRDSLAALRPLLDDAPVREGAR